MARLSTLTFSAVGLALASVASACWEQCGGLYYTGPTTCASPCICTYSNNWYSQCLPAGTTSSLLLSTSSPRSFSSSSKSTSRSFSKSSASSSKTSSTSKSSSTSKLSSSSSITSTKTSTVVSSTSTSSTSSATVTPTGVTDYWFSFGDSYTQTGFEITGTLPNDANPFGNPVYPGYTACGMVTNWIDVDTVKYNASKIYTYNFAYGGATIDANLVTPYMPTVKSLTDQVNSFLATVGTKPPSTPWNSGNSLFSFFIGINDIGNSWWLPESAAFADTLLNAYFALVQQIYSAGGRNFLFINVPGVDRSPLMLAQPAESQAGEKVVIEQFNTKLAAKAAAFKASHTDVTTWIYDAHATLVQILDNPTSYGLADATSYGSAANVAWCNDYHISSAVHEIYGQEIASLLASN